MVMGMCLNIPIPKQHEAMPQLIYAKALGFYIKETDLLWLRFLLLAAMVS
jgi:hypothetical protein